MEMPVCQYTECVSSTGATGKPVAAERSQPTDPFMPLAGVRVLDLTRILAGPYCTLLLGDLGAEVIKVERPGDGDDARSWGPPFVDDGQSSYFAALNRDKKSVVVDLRSPAGVSVFHRLAESSDVLIENFRPGVTERLRIDYPTLSGINGRLVYCSITAFSESDERTHLPGTEVIVEALSGLMATTGTPDGPPVRFGAAMVDIATGLSAATA